MPGAKARNRTGARHKVARIRAAEAAVIFSQCDRFLMESRDLLKNLTFAGISQLLGRLDEKILQLAIQPDYWGERTRARLISEIAPALCVGRAEDSPPSLKTMVQITNVVMPCFLLELGHRKQHVHAEFPANPIEAGASFKIAVGTGRNTHSLTTDALLELVSNAGEALVGLCYFGDGESATHIEDRLSAAPTSGRSRKSRRTLSSSAFRR